MGNPIPSADASSFSYEQGRGEKQKKQDEAILIIDISEIKFWTINDLPSQDKAQESIYQTRQMLIILLLRVRPGLFCTFF